MKSNTEKVAIYVDGSNLYFSVKKAFGAKIDLKRLCEKLTVGKEIVKINYYIAPVGESNPAMYAEQQRFLEKLRKIDKLNIIFGRLEKRKSEGKVYYVEKATDVNLALDLALDAQKGEYDSAFLISNDGDFSGAVSSAVNFGKEIVYAAIGNNKTISHHLRKVASRTLKIKEDFIKDCLLR